MQKKSAARKIFRDIWSARFRAARRGLGGIRRAACDILHGGAESRSEEQHAVAVGVEAVTEANGVVVGGEDGVEAGGGSDLR